MDGLPVGREVYITVFLGDVHNAWPAFPVLPPRKEEKNVMPFSWVKDNIRVKVER